MLRVVLAVAVGYAVISLLMLCGFLPAFLVMGPDRSLAPNSYDPSGLLLTVWFMTTALAAVLGGRVAEKIAPALKAPLALGLVVLVMGASRATTALSSPKPTMQRTSGTSVLEAMRNARQPPWTAIATPFIGFAGVMVGGRGGRKTWHRAVADS